MPSDPCSAPFVAWALAPGTFPFGFPVEFPVATGTEAGYGCCR